MSRWSTALATAVVGLLTTVPCRGADQSAHRVDTEVFGWNADFTQVAAVATSAYRSPLGATRSQMRLVVWGTDSVRALRNVPITGDAQLAQVQLVGATLKLASAGSDYAGTWPHPPSKEQPAGAMSVETIWDPVTAGGSDCRAAVGFILEARGRIRFQPHEVIPDVRGKCDLLRMTQVRTYWGRPDIAVAMAKFEWSPDEHEMSFRQPVSAKWSRARELHILVRTNDPKGARTDRITRALARYGRIRIEGVGRRQKSGITASNELVILGGRITNELDLPREPGVLEGGADIVVTLGDDDPVRSAARESTVRFSRR